MDTVYFEISGFCNAECLYCPNGNGMMNDSPKRFIPIDEFRSAIDHLVNINLISESTTLHLYNWGDPIMHPGFEEILEFLNTKGINHVVSTNGSLYKDIKDSPFLKRIIFSMSGASQETYDMMHGITYDTVITNIKRYMECIDNSKIEIRFFVYTFNRHEINNIKSIFPSINIILPYCMDRVTSLGIMRGEVVPQYMDMSYLQYIPRENQCYLIPDNIVIDEWCDVLQCCGIAKFEGGYSIGSIYEFANENDIQSKRRVGVICNECLSLNVPGYWLHTHEYI